MIYKLTSSKKVIAKVFADLNLREGEYRITDMMEWVGEALLKIGAVQSLIPKVTGRGGLPLLTVSNYQAKLPCDFHSLNFVSYASSENGQFIPMRTGTGVYDSSPDATDTSGSGAPDVIPEWDIIRTAQILYGWPYEQALHELNSDPDLKITIRDLLLEKKSKRIVSYSTFTDDYTFVVVNGYIKTNVRDGVLMLSYNAIPTDAEGYVLIPDKESFIEAMYWYVNMKLSYSEWRLGQIPTGVYEHAESKWRFYARQAYGDAMMPDAPSMVSIINNWNKLFPSFTEHHSGYSNLGRQELVYNVNADR